MPSNTLVINIGSPSETYYLPARDLDVTHLTTSLPSPTAHSDGELEAEKKAISEKAAAKVQVDVLAKSRKESKMRTTAPYGDLLKCALSRG